MSLSFILPVFETSQNLGCPPTMFEISRNGTGVWPIIALQLEGTNGNLRVLPTDQSLHKGYEFYLKVTADGVLSEFGDNTAFFGPFELNVGCLNETVIVTDPI